MQFYARAMKEFDEALKLEPKNRWFWHERGYLYLHLGEHKKAIDAHTTAIELNPLDAELYERRGQSYEALGLLDEAKADQARAVELRHGNR
jgi:tetratricopeptide (TPR) repeat protein